MVTEVVTTRHGDRWRRFRCARCGCEYEGALLEGDDGVPCPECWTVTPPSDDSRDPAEDGGNPEAAGPAAGSDARPSYERMARERIARGVDMALVADAQRRIASGKEERDKASRSRRADAAGPDRQRRRAFTPEEDAKVLAGIVPKGRTLACACARRKYLRPDAPRTRWTEE